MHHLEVTNGLALLNIGTLPREPPANIHNKATSPQVDGNLDCSTVRAKQPWSLTVEQTNRMWYDGILGWVKSHKKLKRSGHSSDTRQNQTCVLIEEDSIMISPSFIRRAFELRFCNSFGRVPKSLHIYPVMMDDDPIFEMCQRGDMEGMQVALSGGNLSPLVVDNHGRTLLHVCGCIMILTKGEANHA